MLTGSIRCCFCGTRRGDIVLDLGRQPSSELFPTRSDPRPDAMGPVRLWLCGECGLAQLADRGDVPKEVIGVEPEALRRQRREAAAWLAGTGLVRGAGAVAEYASPHGGSWLPELRDAGLVGRVAGPDEAGDLVVDACFGVTHEPDQNRAFQERAARLRPGGLLVIQFHSLSAILRHHQWTAIRSGHLAYYSTPAVVEMLARVGLTAVAARDSRLHGGTVTLVASRAGRDDDGVDRLSRYERTVGVLDPSRLAALQAHAESSAAAVVETLQTARDRGEVVLGYSAASRAVALLVFAGVNRDLLPAVADAAPGKIGSRIGGTDIPIIDPSEMAGRRPDTVWLFVPDLLDEARRSVPEIEHTGGIWYPVFA